MTYTQAAALADAVDQGSLSMDQALRFHFRQNHFPALPVELIPVAKKAIVFAGFDEWDAEIRLPQEWAFGGTDVMTVGQAVETFHLSAFVRASDLVAA